MNQLNQSGVRPTGHRIMVKPDEVETVSASGIIISQGNQAERERMAQIRGTLVDVGSCAWADQKHSWGLKVGDRVLFAKYRGVLIGKEQSKDGCEYRLLDDLDIAGVLE